MTPPIFQHILDTYSSETNKTASVWRCFEDADLSWRPHLRSSTVEEIMTHQLLSERRFFAEFLGSPELPAPAVLPANRTVSEFGRRLVELATPRLPWLAGVTPEQWLDPVKFFDVQRERS